MKFFINIWQDVHEPPRREVVARVLISMLGAATAILSLVVPSTFTYAMLRVGGAPAYAAVAALGIIALLLFFDTVVNDVMSSRFRFQWAYRARQQLWMGLGLLFVLFAFLVFTTGLSKSLGTYLLIFAAGSFMLAFVDAARERAEKRCAS